MAADSTPLPPPCISSPLWDRSCGVIIAKADDAAVVAPPIRPLPSPAVVTLLLSEAAERGEALFHVGW